ncbi:MAG: ribonuclease HII [Ktedonobacterales bacterium]
MANRQRTMPTYLISTGTADITPCVLSQPSLLLANDLPPAVRLCGLDEVGRGALAGPLVAAAVILPDDIGALLGPLARFLRDSKTVPAPRRTEIAAKLHELALAVEVVVIAVEEINTRGIGWANREAFRQLIAAITADEYVVDGKLKPSAPPERAALVRCQVKADATVPAVAAASLVAKVHRDALMIALAETHPHFGWQSNVGYGSAAHLAALRTHGPTPEHRTLFVTTALSGGQRARNARKKAVQAPLLTGEVEW